MPETSWVLCPKQSKFAGEKSGIGYRKKSILAFLGVSTKSFWSILRGCISRLQEEVIVSTGTSADELHILLSGCQRVLRCIPNLLVTCYCVSSVQMQLALVARGSPLPPICGRSIRTA